MGVGKTGSFPVRDPLGTSVGGQGPSPPPRCDTSCFSLNLFAERRRRRSGRPGCGQDGHDPRPPGSPPAPRHRARNPPGCSSRSVNTPAGCESGLRTFPPKYARKFPARTAARAGRARPGRSSLPLAGAPWRFAKIICLGDADIDPAGSRRADFMVLLACEKPCGNRRSPSSHAGGCELRPRVPGARSQTGSTDSKPGSPTGSGPGSANAAAAP